VLDATPSTIIPPGFPLDANQTSLGFVSPPASGAATPGNDMLAVAPLDKAELVRLKALLQNPKPSPAEEKEREGLLKRLGESGVKFTGADELGVLNDILTAASKLPAGKLVTMVFDAYTKMIDIASALFQNLDEALYKQYKTNRDYGAPHDEAWPYVEGGDKYRLRYEIEKIKARIDAMKKAPPKKIEDAADYATP